MPRLERAIDEAGDVQFRPFLHFLTVVLCFSPSSQWLRLRLVSVCPLCKVFDLYVFPFFQSLFWSFLQPFFYLSASLQHTSSFLVHDSTFTRWSLSFMKIFTTRWGYAKKINNTYEAWEDMAVPGEYDTMPTRIALIVQATMMRTSTITYIKKATMRHRYSAFVVYSIKIQFVCVMTSHMVLKNSLRALTSVQYVPGKRSTITSVPSKTQPLFVCVHGV